MAIREITVPDIGDVKDVDIIELPVQVGQHINKDDTIIVVETEKATMEVPSPTSGVITEIKVKVGSKVSKGSLVLMLDEVAAETVPSSVPASTPASIPASIPAPVAAVAAVSSVAVKAVAPVIADSKAVVETAAEMRTVDLVVPDIGGAKGVSIIEMLIKADDSVVKDQGLLVLETDKATMEVPSPYIGVIESVSVKVGDKVEQGSVIGRIRMQTISAASSTSSKLNVAALEPDLAVNTAPTRAAVSPMLTDQFGMGAPVPDYPVQRRLPGEKFVHASPSVRQFARELGVDLEKVTGTGPKLRILKDDVQSFVKFELSRPKPVATAASGAPSLPDIDFSRWGEIEKTSLTRIQKVSSVNLHRNWLTIPHVTQHEDADITEMEAFRQSLKDEAEKRGVKLTPLVFVMKALVNTLQAFPTLNASLAADGETLVLKKYWHIGVAVDTPDGLVVPVVRDVNHKSLFDLSAELAEISKKARDKKLGADAMQGSTFTISSLGGIGGTYFTPIVAWPNVAILGLSKNATKPVWNGSAFVPRLMLPMSLSYDHRVIDGAVGARFITHLAKNLADIRRLLL